MMNKKKLTFAIIFLTIFLFGACSGNKSENKTDDDSVNTEVVSENNDARNSTEKVAYEIILKTESIPGNINTEVINNLPEYLKGIVALYAALGGSNCDGTNCELTTALGLGNQGSVAHKETLKKYFPDDELVEILVEQDCFLPPSGASNFSDYEYLTITVEGNEIVVDYNLILYNRGNSETLKGPDYYSFNDGHYVMESRNIGN